MAASLDDLIRTSELPVFIDFWADWCGPCKMVAPAVQQLAREFKGRLTVVKVNVDQQPEAAARFQVQGIPAAHALRRWAGQVAHLRSAAVSADAPGGAEGDRVKVGSVPPVHDHHVVKQLHDRLRSGGYVGQGCGVEHGVHALHFALRHDSL